MKKATTVGLLMVFVLFTVLFLANHDLATSEVSLANMTTKTTHGPVAYKQLEPVIINSASRRVMEVNGSNSLFDSPQFLWTFVILFLFVLSGYFIQKALCKKMEKDIETINRILKE